VLRRQLVAARAGWRTPIPAPSPPQETLRPGPLIARVFEPVDQNGVACVFPCSGSAPAAPYDALDADFMQASSPGIQPASLAVPSICIAARVSCRAWTAHRLPSFGVGLPRSGRWGTDGVCGRGLRAYWHPIANGTGSAAAEVP